MRQAILSKCPPERAPANARRGDRAEPNRPPARGSVVAFLRRGGRLTEAADSVGTVGRAG
jgi:hypothetical protein